MLGHGPSLQKYVACRRRRISFTLVVSLVSFTMINSCLVPLSTQEYPSIMDGLVVRNTNSEASTPSLASSPRYYLRPSIYRLWLLFCRHETVCPVHASRGISLHPSCDHPLIINLIQTGWGTRAGIGDASAATAAMEQQNEKQVNDNNNNDPYRRPLSPNESFAQYRDQTPSPFSETPIYAARSQSGHGGTRKKDEVEMQVGFAQ